MRKWNALKKICYAMIVGCPGYIALNHVTPLQLLLACICVWAIGMYGSSIVETVQTNFNHSQFAQEMWYAVTIVAISGMIATSLLFFGIIEGVIVFVISIFFVKLGKKLTQINVWWVIATVTIGVASMLAFSLDEIPIEIGITSLLILLLIANTKEKEWSIQSK